MSSCLLFQCVFYSDFLVWLIWWRIPARPPFLPANTAQHPVSMGRSCSSRRFSDPGSRACFFHFFCWFTHGGSARCTTPAHEATDQAFARTLASCAWTWSVFFASWGIKSCDLLSRLGSGDKWAGWEGGCPDCGTPCRLVIGVGLCKDCWSVGVWLVQA